MPWIKWQPELPHTRVTVELGVFSAVLVPLAPLAASALSERGPAVPAPRAPPEPPPLRCSRWRPRAARGHPPQSLLAQLLTAWGRPCDAFEGEAIVTTRVMGEPEAAGGVCPAGTPSTRSLRVPGSFLPGQFN